MSAQGDEGVRRKKPASESMVVQFGGTGELSSHIIIVSGWSSRLWPIPGMW